MALAVTIAIPAYNLWCSLQEKLSNHKEVVEVLVPNYEGKEQPPRDLVKVGCTFLSRP